MKLGFENRKTTIAAVILTVIAVPVFWRSISGSMPSTSNQPTAVVSSNKPKQGQVMVRRGRGRSIAVPNAGDPTLRLELLKESEEMKYQGSGRNIFRAEAEEAKIETPIKPPINPTPPGPQPPVNTGPPPINLKFYGFASRPGEPKKAFLSQGEDIFIASEGEIVSRRYRVVKINPTSIEIEDVLNNNKQIIPLTQG